MGQRHMTYVIVEDIGKNCYRQRISMLALYNQWNYETVQPVKVSRFLTAIKAWNKNKVIIASEEIATLYQYAASVSPYSLCRFSPENENYDATYGMYDEDNNNGWQIVYVKYDSDKCKSEVFVAFKPGNEWREDYESKGYLSLKDYLDGYLGNNSNDKEGYDFESFVAKHNKKEQKLLKQINASYDAKEIERAERIVREEIEKIQARKAKQAA